MDTKEKKAVTGAGRKSNRSTTRTDTATKSSSTQRRRKQSAATPREKEVKKTVTEPRKVRRPVQPKTETVAPDVVYTPPKPFNRDRFLLRMGTVVAVVIALMFGISIFFRVEHVKVSGAAKFRGICNGDATSLETFTKPTMKVFNGELVVVVEAGQASGDCLVTVASEGLVGATVRVPVTAARTCR